MMSSSAALRRVLPEVRQNDEACNANAVAGPAALALGGASRRGTLAACGRPRRVGRVDFGKAAETLPSAAADPHPPGARPPDPVPAMTRSSSPTLSIAAEELPDLPAQCDFGAGVQSVAGFEPATFGL
jgi:hypothetical protein